MCLFINYSNVNINVDLASLLLQHLSMFRLPASEVLGSHLEIWQIFVLFSLGKATLFHTQSNSNVQNRNEHEHGQSRGLSHIFMETVPDLKLQCSFTLFNPHSGTQQETTEMYLGARP